MGLAQTKPHYTEEEYLALERAATERHEYLDGTIYAMAGESEAHGLITSNAGAEINMQLRRTPCAVFVKDTKVRSGPLPTSRFRAQGFYSYPDLVVVCGKRQYHDLYRDVLLNPTVIVEVLSPSTEGYDWGRKSWLYREYLQSLTDYILIAQDEPLVYHLGKDADGRWVITTANGLEASLRVDSINCTLRLADIYDRVEFPAEEETGN